MVQILDVMQKALEGEPMSENDYLLRRFSQKVKEKVKQYEISFDPNEPVPSDDSLADDIFRAGFELLLDVGVYCSTTERVISYSENEIKEGLRNAPKSIFFGEGRDRKEFVPRKIEDREPPWCLLGAAGGACTDEKMLLTLMQGYAEIPETNAITTPALTRIGGMRIRPASPLEALGAMRNAVLAREACDIAGREGIPFMNTIATAESGVALAGTLHPKFRLRPSDGYMIACLDPLKVDFDRLNKVTVVQSIGGNVGMDFSPLLGGYAGGPEGTAVSAVAHHLMGMLTYQTSYLVPFPLHLKYISNSSRNLIWVISTMGQAISRNTHLLSLSLNYTSAGPCTTMCLYETSASVISAIVSGLSQESVGVATNKKEDLRTPAEPRISAEVGHAVAGMKRSDANEIVKELLKKYESNLNSPPLGKGIYECWDVDRRKPTQEYIGVINEFKKEISKLGIDLRPEE